MKVALIAADAMSQVLVEEHLAAMGHILSGSARTLEEALDVLGRCAPDVVLLDPYFDSALVDPTSLDTLLSAAQGRIVLMGVDVDRDAELIGRLRPFGIISAPPGREELAQVLAPAG